MVECQMQMVTKVVPGYFLIDLMVASVQLTMLWIQQAQPKQYKLKQSVRYECYSYYLNKRKLTLSLFASMFIFVSLDPSNIILIPFFSFYFDKGIC